MKRFEHIVIASDLDGTLLAQNEAGDARNRDRIRYFIENGGHFTIASGRCSLQIEGRIPYPTDLLNLPAVTVNGTCLYDFGGGRAVEEHFMPHATVLRISEYLKAYFPSVAPRASTPIGMLAENTDNPYIQQDAARMRDFFTVCPVSEWEKIGVYKMGLRGDADQISALWEAMTRDFADELEMAPSASTLLDVQAKGRTKAALLADLVKKIPHPTVLCTVGDYDNDAEMHRVADLACAPANAVERIQEICPLHLCHHSEGVIGDLIDYLDTHDVSHLAKQRSDVHG